MAGKMEYYGKDVDEAINQACVALNVARTQLNIEIKSTGSTGIFGLCRKKASILVSLKKDTVKRSAATVQSVTDITDKQQIKTQEKTEESKGDPVPVETVKEIKDDLEKLLELMSCPAAVTIVQDEQHKLTAKISGDDIHLIVGQEGLVLDSLQYLLRKMINRKFPSKIMISLDAGDFRINRTQELQKRALAIAKEVKSTGKTRTMPAINPAERRIVHLVLQDDSSIRSRSIGDGLFKKILIYPPGKGRKRPPKKPHNSSRQKQ